MKNRILIIAIILALSACGKEPVYSPIPLIDFKQVMVADTSDVLGNLHQIYSIYFKILDGDGNFGFKDEDTSDSQANINNFYIDVYTKLGGIKYKINNDSVTFDGKIPWVKPVGLQTYYKATVIYDLHVYAIPFDSIKFVFHVIDRAQNSSNNDSTIWIPRGFRGDVIDTVTLIPEGTN